MRSFFFFFTHRGPPEISTLSLHRRSSDLFDVPPFEKLIADSRVWAEAEPREDRKSTRLNSSHVAISYAVFCLKKKNGSCQRANAHPIRRRCNRRERRRQADRRSP